MTQAHISERAMLANLTISIWSASKLDAVATDDIARMKRAEKGAGRYTKRLVDKHAMADIKQVVHEARDFHRRNTLPWADDGHRILPSANYFEYTAAQARFKERFEEAVRAFCGGYRDHVAEARKALGDLFSVEDYPRPEEIEGKFGITTSITPLPHEDDFRVQIGGYAETQIRTDLARRIEESAGEAMRDVWDRIHDAVSHMADRLHSYGQDPATGKTINPFRSSIVQNMRDLADLLPRLNLTGDPLLESTCRELKEKLCRFEPDQLRKNEMLRQSVATEADQILANMAGYTGAMAS